MTFKLVTIQYPEQAQLVVRADTDEAAREQVMATLSHIPDLTIVNIEEASEDIVAQALGNVQQENRSLN